MSVTKDDKNEIKKHEPKNKKSIFMYNNNKTQQQQREWNEREREKQQPPPSRDYKITKTIPKLGGLGPTDSVTIKSKV